MRHLTFSSNYIGKLHIDMFNDVRMDDPEVYYIGNEFEVFLNKAPIGVVKVVALRKFKYGQIRDVLSYQAVGQNAAYLAKMLCNFYNHGKQMDPETCLVHIVCSWKERYYNVQEQLLENFRTSKATNMSEGYLMRNGLFDNFVSPNLCKDLELAGVTPVSSFTWKSRGGKIRLYGHEHLDPDGYYSDAELIIDNISKPDYALPAYTITDLQKGVTDYCLSRHDDSYMITIANRHDVPTITSSRMPDAFARLMLELIRKKLIDINKVNTLIEG